MQKFTRAVTREIEVGGKRLAVTLDESGVSIRPVGSRKAPAVLAWDRVVCAAVGMPVLDDLTPADIAAALTHLGDVPAKADPDEPASDLTTLLAKWEKWLAKNRPEYLDALNPPAGKAELARLEKGLGRPVPQELQDWLKWHNGSDEESFSAFYEAFIYLDSSDILQALKDAHDEKIPGWQPAWIPFMDDQQGDYLVLDPVAPGCAVREVWRGKSDHPVVSPTLQGWLESLLKDAEAGKYAEDPERGEFQRLRG